MLDNGISLVYNEDIMNIKELRKSNGLTQFQLAVKLEVQPREISRWETGKSKPNKANIEKIKSLEV